MCISGVVVKSLTLKSLMTLIISSQCSLPVGTSATGLRAISKPGFISGRKAGAKSCFESLLCGLWVQLGVFWVLVFPSTRP